MPPEGLTGKTINGETLRVREVWDDNLAEEIAVIRDIVEDYPYVAMDTEFPGVVARPVGNFKSSREYHYKVRTAAAAAVASCGTGMQAATHEPVMLLIVCMDSVNWNAAIHVRGCAATRTKHPGALQAQRCCHDCLHACVP